jgi:archaellum component FlaF (FlaF/FlaG flagellin family)
VQLRKILIAILLVVAVTLAIAHLLTQQYVGMIPPSLQASDFLGQWYNVNPYPTNVTISSLFVNENQGTYTIDVDQHCAYIQYGGCQSADWGTSTLAVSPPNAHAFYTFQSGGSVDLQLKLLDATSMQVKESSQELPLYGMPASTSVKYEQFAKASVNYATTSSSDTTSIISTTLTLPPTQGDCGVRLEGGFNATAGQILTGSVSASTMIDVYVMTTATYQAWVYQYRWEGGGCTPSSFVASWQGRTSYSISLTIPADAFYAYVIVNPSGTTITAQIILNLITGSSSYSQTVQSQQYATTTPTTTATHATTSAFDQVTSLQSGSEKLVLSNYRWDMSSNSIWVAITNMGTVAIDLPQSSVFINGIPATPPPSSCGTLAPGWNCGYVFTPPSGNWVVGTTYTLTIETPEGVVFSFSIVAGESG